MKNLLIAILVLGSLVSCGKKNVAPGANTGTGIASPLTVTGQIETQLGSIVDNNQFGNGQFNYYTNWSTHVSQAPNTTYNFGALNTQNSSNCHTVWTIFQVCSSSVSSSSTSNTAITRSVVHSSVAVVDRQNAIKDLINRRAYVQSAGYGIYYIVTTDNNSYIIDTKLPIQANPVQSRNASGVGETLISVQ